MCFCKWANSGRLYAVKQVLPLAFDFKYTVKPAPKITSAIILHPCMLSTTRLLLVENAAKKDCKAGVEVGDMYTSHHQTMDYLSCTKMRAHHKSCHSSNFKFVGFSVCTHLRNAKIAAWHGLLLLLCGAHMRARARKCFFAFVSTSRRVISFIHIFLFVRLNLYLCSCAGATIFYVMTCMGVCIHLPDD